jgi:hypothetical protein
MVACGRHADIVRFDQAFPFINHNVLPIMLRSSLLVFIAGWAVWFWIDKPRAGPFQLPPPADSLVENFQRAFDILKTGHVELAFVYIWNAHYLVLSLLGGAVVTIAYSSLAGHLSRQRLRKRMVPEKRVEKPADTTPPSGQRASPGDERDA